MSEFIFHIATISEWSAAQQTGVYRPASLTTEGFIHCSTAEQVVSTADRFFSGQTGLLVLLIDPGKTAAALRYEKASHDLPAENGQPAPLFPHLYGALEIGAVRLVLPFPPGPDGRFSLPPEVREYAASDPRQVRFRKARRSDIPAIEALIAESARALGGADYSAAQIDAALKTAWGVDSQLIDDETYYVGEHRQRLVACGGWSHRHTLFGGDAQPDRIARELDPALESARIRAFFVHPAWSRLGLGRRLLAQCEDDAERRGFRSARLVATLPGQRLYSACGYQSEAPEEYALGGDQSITFVAMHKLF